MSLSNRHSPDRRIRFGSMATVLCAALALSLVAADRVEPAETGPAIAVKPIAAEKLANVPGNTLSAVVVDLEPGAKSPPHHHAGFVFAYVLSGTVRSQLNRGKIADYEAGQSWVEPPGTEHTLTENPSKTTPASLLAVFVAPDGAKLTTFNK
jgi:quercetin dioxygenase-like cupin family protein